MILGHALNFFSEENIIPVIRPRRLSPPQPGGESAHIMLKQSDNPPARWPLDRPLQDDLGQWCVARV